MKFYLGTHQPQWLTRVDVPLFVSDRTLRQRRTLRRAMGPWALDSGGFTELSTHGNWSNGPTPAEYASRVCRYRETVGGLIWAAPQDWMCEPYITAKTGLTVAERQRRTIGNFLELRSLAPVLPFAPVLQGWRRDDYLACVDLYTAAGVDLSAEPIVGLGSVCRRQGTSDAAAIVTDLVAAVPGIRLHGFGIKITGLRRYGALLTSADSMAWSYTARRQPALTGCAGHRNCANCLRYVLAWRTRILAQPLQQRLGVLR
ncbi:hypothetical protein [Nocardia terpenica]|uniref:DeoxyPurine in DNA protein A domain-containing protein n=1 Tax=Nocardia terpenica TaxID=455432 RepID=A0A164MEV8_9NOCA|nr:hypothetical protein [Nocardia terpenica]KZM73296.1 hypothetical protein AWN90_32045 [Nocardia terpenica]NQE87554.1 hypothetical protein [Nocardia terpenica]